MNNEFSDIEIKRDGKQYIIKSNEVMRLIAKVESIITLDQLITSMNGGAVPLAKVSMAYGCMLRYAGCPVRDEQIYTELFSDADAIEAAQGATTNLLMLMVPQNITPPKKKKRKKSRKKSRRKTQNSLESATS